MALIETDKIYLRALEPEDLDTLYLWENDVELWRFGSSLRPYSKFEIKKYIAGSVQDIVNSRQLRLMIMEKLSGKPAGMIDLYDYDPINLRAGVGVLLGVEFRKKGYGLDALNSVKRYANRFLHIHTLFAHIPESNTASIALFSASGFEKAGLLTDWIKTDKGFENVVLLSCILC
jgi:diamine N-acetyltransferase